MSSGALTAVAIAAGVVGLVVIVLLIKECRPG
jgi:hypothetical protein